MKNPGIIVKLPDDRIAIVYSHQPLVKEKGKAVLNLVDENYQPIVENGRAKILMKDVDDYNLLMDSAKFIGYVD